eukprot:scaffold1436_cov140-Amphora_coffeaeformis.AAC.3
MSQPSTICLLLDFSTKQKPGMAINGKGEEENSLVNQSPKDEDPVESFGEKGFLQLTELVSPKTCQQLRDLILQDLETTLQADEKESERRFSNIRDRNHRWDLKLEASPLVHQAMREILSRSDFLRSVLAPLCQCDPENVVLAELGSLISEPGAKHQEWHADSLHTGPIQPDCICCFVTLQKTPLSMGPTQLIPWTHLADFHESACSNFPPKGLMPTSVEPKTMQNGYAAAGEALLMDCRLYHRGSANTHTAGDDDGDDPKIGKRVVFYFTVRSRTARRPGGFFFTILHELDEMPVVDFLENQP